MNKAILIRNFFILLLTFLNTSIFSQNTIGNEWIGSNQKYLKLVIDKDGIYRITKELIEKTGLNTNNLDPRNFQLFFRGKPYSIYFKGEGDGIFNNDDYLEFYAIANDGLQDEEVYRPKEARANKYLSLYSNETAYFLIYNNKEIGKRIELKTKEFETIPEEYFFKTIKKSYSNDWNHDITTSAIPSLLQSYFEPNESLMSSRIRLSVEPTTFSENIILKNLNTSIEDTITFNIKLGSRNYPNKVIKLSLDQNSKLVNLNDYNTVEATLNKINLKEENVTLKANFESSTSNIIVNDKKQDAFSILYYLIKYPSKTIYSESIEYELEKNPNGSSLLKLSNGNTNVVGFDINDIYNQKKLNIEFEPNSNNLNVYVENTQNGGNLFLSSMLLSPSKIEKIEFPKKDLSEINYIIITDSTLLNGANEYKKYRETQEGGSNKVLIVEKHKLFNEFSYGERNPIAIHRFADFMLKNSKVKNLLLLGKALSYPTLSKTNPELDLVPSWGYPASDVLLTSGLNGKHIDVPAIPTGRVSAISNEEVLAYLDKVKSFEANNKISKNWNKSFLQLGGGKGEGQVTEFKSFLGKLGKIAENSLVGAKFEMINKTKLNDGVEEIDISKQINNGVGMVTFFGHSSSSSLDLNIGFASDEKANFKNGPLFPFMFFNGCGAGNVFNTYTSLSKDWLMTKNKGAIAILAHSFLSFSNSNMDYMEKLYKTWFSSTENLNLSLGSLVQKVAEIQIKENPNDIYTMANVHEMILQGDPAIRIFNMTKPDFQTEDGKLFLTSTAKNKAVADGDSLKLGIIVANYGIYEAGTTLNLNLKKTFSDGKSTDQSIKIKAVAYQDTVFVNLKKDLNLKFVSISVDNDLKIDEMDEANNTGSITFNWETLKNTIYYSTATLPDVLNPNLDVKLEGKFPINGMEVGTGSVLEVNLIDENSLGVKTDKLEISYRQVCETCPVTLKKLDLGTISGLPNEILTKIDLKSLIAGEYEIFIQGYDAKKNSSGEVFSFKFKIVDGDKASVVKVYPNPMTLYATFEVNVWGSNLSENSNYILEIFDSRGINVKSKTDKLNSGINNIYWEGTSNNGEKISPGLYIYKLVINKNGTLEQLSGQIRYAY